jgi:hypothetical protein
MVFERWFWAMVFVSAKTLCLPIVFYRFCAIFPVHFTSVSFDKTENKQTLEPWSSVPPLSQFISSCYFQGFDQCTVLGSIPVSPETFLQRCMLNWCPRVSGLNRTARMWYVRYALCGIKCILVFLHRSFFIAIVCGSSKRLWYVRYATVWY